MTVQQIITFIPVLIFKSVLYIISFVILLTFYIICFFYRIIVTIIIKLQYKEAIFLSSIDSFLAYGRTPDESQLLFSYLCSGTVDIDFFRSRLMEIVINSNNNKLTCYVKEKFGYFFWIKEENFNIEHHVIYHPDVSIYTKDQWDKFQKKLFYETATRKDVSPWWVHFIPLPPEYEEGEGNFKFYMVSMWRHCLADGYSGLHVFLKGIADIEEPRVMLPSLPPSSFLKEAFLILQGFFFIPYFAAERIIFQSDIFIRSKKHERQICSDLGIIETRVIKAIKHSARVPFFVVLLTSMMGALEKYFLKSNIPIPPEITVSIPQVLWRPEDEVVLTNNFIVVYYTLPFNLKSTVHRLEEINRIMRSNRTRNQYMCNYTVMKILGSLVPSFCGRWIGSKENPSVILSMAAVEQFPHLILGNRKMPNMTVNRMFTLFSNCRLFFHAFTVGGTISLSIHSNSSLVSEENLREMMRDFQEELEIMNVNL